MTERDIWGRNLPAHSCGNGSDVTQVWTKAMTGAYSRSENHVHQSSEYADVNGRCRRRLAEIPRLEDTIETASGGQASRVLRPPYDSDGVVVLLRFQVLEATPRSDIPNREYFVAGYCNQLSVP